MRGIGSRPLMDPWRDAFLLQLRLRDVSGAAIGDALAQVDAHCAESGDEPEQAFGEPVAYADSLAGLLTRSRPTRPVQAAVLAAGTVVGANALLSGVDGAAHAEPGVLTVGSLVVALVVAVLSGAFVRAMPLLLGGGRRWPLALLLAVGIGVGGAAPLLLPGAVLRMPGGVLALVGVIVLAAVWFPWLGGRRLDGGTTTDRVIDPRTGREPFVTPPWVDYVRWAVPVLVVGAALALILDRG